VRAITAISSSEVDWSLGQIVDALARNKLADNTLLIFTSDNGAHSEPLHLEEKYGHKANADFRGQKSDCLGRRPPYPLHRPLARPRFPP
jgi:arylsulfatase A